MFFFIVTGKSLRTPVSQGVPDTYRLKLLYFTISLVRWNYPKVCIGSTKLSHSHMSSVSCCYIVPTFIFSAQNFADTSLHAHFSIACPRVRSFGSTSSCHSSFSPFFLSSFLSCHVLTEIASGYSRSSCVGTVPTVLC